VKLTESVALVTGSNRGLGMAFAERLIARGIKKIYVTARDASLLENLVKLNPNSVCPITLDITQQRHIEDVLSRATDVTLLINNAGCNRNAALLGVAGIENAREEMETNYFGTLSMCRAFAPVLKNNGGGTIVNILSILSLVNLPASGSFSVSKAAAYSMNQGVRAELSGQNTSVVGVMPGSIDTDMARDFEGPKDKPVDVVDAVLQAIEDGIEDVYPGEMAQAVYQGHRQDAKAIEKEFAVFVS